MRARPRTVTPTPVATVATLSSVLPVTASAATPAMAASSRTPARMASPVGCRSTASVSTTTSGTAPAATILSSGTRAAKRPTISAWTATVSAGLGPRPPALSAAMTRTSLAPSPM